jgi:hypothetical protein
MRIAILIIVFFIQSDYVRAQYSWIGKYKVEHSKRAKSSYSEVEIDSSDNSPESRGDYEWIFKAYQKDTLVWYASGYSFLSNGILKMYVRTFTAHSKAFENNRKYFSNENEPRYEIINESGSLFIWIPNKKKKKFRLVPIS